jgi:dTDP-4-dehydrorhamnose reductase
MKLFITGISGLLGLNIALEVGERYQVSGSYYTHPVALDGGQAVKLDLASFEVAERTLRHFQPDVVIHTVGLTSVDACEADPALAYSLNVEAANFTAKSARALGAKLVHISTDHLFDGIAPWRREEDAPYPLNVYARTKAQAEDVVLQACPDALVIRTNFFGWGTSVRASFSDWIINSLEQGRELTMFYDVFFTPILINDLVELILGLVGRGAKGIFHVTGGERVSKYDFAIKLAEVFDYPRDKIRAISVENFSFKALRPKDMSLSSEKAEKYLRMPMPTVAEGLERLRSLESGGIREALAKAIQKELPFQGAVSLTG